MKSKIFDNIKKADPEQKKDWAKLQSSKALWFLIALYFALIQKSDISMITFAFAGASNAREQYKFSEKYTNVPKERYVYIILGVIAIVFMVFLFPTTEKLLNLLNVSHFNSEPFLNVLTWILKIVVTAVLYYLYLFLFEWLFGSIYGIINLSILKFIKDTKD